MAHSADPNDVERKRAVTLTHPTPQILPLSNPAKRCFFYKQNEKSGFL